MGWQYPVKGKFKRGPKFGVVDSWHPNGHRGTDFNGFAANTPYVAVQDGTIAVVKTSAILGNVVVLQVDKAPFGPELKTVYFGYAHMSKPCHLAVGTKVKAGDVIGYAGTTGSASSGVHLHWTLSLLKEGVFGGKVYDADAYVTKRINLEKAGKTAPVAPAPTPATADAPTRCETCPCKNGCTNV